MASDQVYNWINGSTTIGKNKPLLLSKKVESYEQDFSNGYLFGEILCHYGLVNQVSGSQNSLNQFSKKTNKEAQVQNFYLVENAMRSIKVHFDGKIIHKIMQQQKDAALNLLNQIKIALENHFSDSNITATGLKKEKVEEKLKEVAELSSILPSIHHKYGVDGPTFKKTSQIVEKKLLKFEVARANLEKTANQGDLDEQKAKQDLLQSKRQFSIKKLKETHQFFQDWEDQGRKNWKQNREARAKEIERQLYFEDREIKIYKNKLAHELDVHALQAEQGIELFHENMQRLGIEQNISISDAVKRQEEKKGIPPGQIQNFSYPATMSKIKETKANNEFAGKERERRRRKMLVDQQKIQETLDKKKNEEELIIRLLQIQAKEQEKSYNLWRQNQCQLVVNKNMQNQALEFEQVKQKKNQEWEEQIRRETQEGEAARRAEIEAKRQEYQKERRAAKLKKRKLNIEIASEFVDLLLDLAEVAFDTLDENKNKEDEDQLITKPSWRRWMDVFTEGKKVSEENLVIMTDESAGLKVVPSEGPLAKLLNEKADKGELSPLVVVNEMKNEPEYVEFLQYVSMCGPLNLRLVAPQKWHSLSKIPKKFNQIGFEINLGFLDQFYPPLNTELGGLIQNLQEQQGTRMSASKIDALTSFDSINLKQTFTSEFSQTNEEKFKPDFPSYHNLKLCIVGQLFAGKKTIAKAIQKRFGEQKINIFDMSEILREALVYIDPNQVKEEVIDPKSKAPAKGKVVEAPLDIFAGKDTTKYKAIAQKILKSIQLTTGNETSLPGKEVDLIQLITDDELLVQLFLQKLALFYPAQGKTQLEKEAIMRQNLVKRKELEDLIEETKVNEAAEAADPKAKGKGGKAGGAKSLIELQQELKDLMSADSSGWVLIDFPRNIKQAKILENKFTGFTAYTDNEKSESVQNFEVWSKITDPLESKKLELQIKNQQSLFDGFLMLKVSTDECQRRGQNRKVDPTNGQVYHLEDDPPAQGDNKLLERLQDFFGVYQNVGDMNDKVKKSGIWHKSNEQELQKFMNEFGYFDGPIAQGMNTLHVLDAAKTQKKEFTEQKVQTFIDQILYFKQVVQDRSYKELETKIRKEEEAREREAQLAKERETLQSNENEEGEATVQDVVPQVSQPNMEIQDAAQKIADNVARRASRTSFISQKTISAVSHAAKSKQQKRISYTTEHMNKMWDQMAASYMAEGMAALNAIKKQRISVTNGLNNSQRQFITFLQRPCNKQDKVNEFVLSFNKFSSEFPDLRSDDQTKEELKIRVQKLSNDLWEIIDARKNESLAKIAEMTSGGWSDHEMRNLVRNMASLMEIEISKFVCVHHISIFQEPAQELDALILSKKLLDRGTKPYDEATDTSPVLEQVISNLLIRLQEVLNHQAVQSAPIVSQQILIAESRSLIYRLTMINAWALAILDEIYVHSRQVYERMDDWVVEAVAQEYQISSTMISFIKDAINNELLEIEDYQGKLKTLELYQSVQTLQFLSTETPIYLQSVHIPSDDLQAVNFSPLNLQKFMIDIHQALDCDGYPEIIEYQSLLNLLLVNFRQGKFPLVWKYLNFEKIQQNLKNFSTEPIDFKSQNKFLGNQGYQKPKRDWINWKQFITCLVLSRSSIPSELDLTQLQESLQENEKTWINFEQFSKKAFWFDQDEGKPEKSLQEMWRKAKQQELEALETEDDEDEIVMMVDEYIRNKLDEERLHQIKRLIFDINRISTGEDKLEVEEFLENLKELIRLVRNKSGQISKFAQLFLN